MPGHALQVAGLADNVDILLPIQQQAKTPPHQRMVIGEHDPDPSPVHGPRRAGIGGKMQMG